mmetsp:Transcript_36709/g.91964  ORF Transcript_36709/g.91964 Transcript_36709/m.91964 type:complete len:641 (-) Transcript_36709:1937-3859(-)
MDTSNTSAAVPASLFSPAPSAHIPDLQTQNRQLHRVLRSSDALVRQQTRQIAMLQQQLSSAAAKEEYQQRRSKTLPSSGTPGRIARRQAEEDGNAMDGRIQMANESDENDLVEASRQLKDELSASYTKCDQLEDSLLEKTQALIEKTQEANNIRREYIQLGSQYKATRQQNDAKERRWKQTLASLEEDFRQQENTTQKQTTHRGRVNALPELQHQLDMTKACLQGERDAHHALKALHERLKDDMAVLRGELAATKEETDRGSVAIQNISILEATLQQCHSEMVGQASMVTTLEREVAEKLKELSEATETNARLKRIQTSLCGELEAIKKKEETTREALAKADRALEQATASHQEMQEHQREENARLSDTVAHLQRDITAKDKTLASKLEELTRTSSAKEALYEREKAQWKEALQGEDAQHADAQHAEEKRRLERGWQGRMQELEKDQRRMASAAEGDMAELKRQIASLENKAAQLEEEKRRLTTDREDLLVRFKQAEAQIASLVEEREFASRAAAGELSGKNAETAALMVQLAETRQQLEEAHEAVKKTEERDAQHDKDKKALEKALADERHQQESHEAEHEREISQLTEDLKHVKEVSSERERALSDAHKQLQAFTVDSQTAEATIRICIRRTPWPCRR